MTDYVVPTATGGTRTVSISREAAGCAGVAWSYFAALTRGTRGVAEATSILATFREIFNDNRSAVVAALVSVGGRAADIEGALPRTLRPGSTLTADDASALSLSVYPVCVLGRATGETGWGDAAALLRVFMSVPSNARALHDWFVDQLASVWPQGTANAHGRLLWWFASWIRSGDDADTVFSGYIFQGSDNPEGPARAPTVQEMAARLTAASEGDAPDAVAIDIGEAGHITASPSHRRSALWWAVAVTIVLAIAGSSYGLYYYQKKHGGKMPWQKARR